MNIPRFIVVLVCALPGLGFTSCADVNNKVTLTAEGGAGGSASAAVGNTSATGGTASSSSTNPGNGSGSTELITCKDAPVVTDSCRETGLPDYRAGTYEKTMDGVLKATLYTSIEKGEDDIPRLYFSVQVVRRGTNPGETHEISAGMRQGIEGRDVIKATLLGKRAVTLTDFTIVHLDYDNVARTYNCTPWSNCVAGEEEWLDYNAEQQAKELAQRVIAEYISNPTSFHHQYGGRHFVDVHRESIFSSLNLDIQFLESREDAIEREDGSTYGEYRMSFTIVPEEDDVYVPVENAFTYHIENADGDVVENPEVTVSFHSNESQENGFFKIAEGDVGTVTMVVRFTPPKTGSYRVVVNGFRHSTVPSNTLVDVWTLTDYAADRDSDLITLQTPYKGEKG